jgi:hypothetical protein
MNDIKSNQIIKPGIQSIDFQGMEIFKKNENLFDSEIFGIKLKYLVMIAGIFYFIKNK